MTDSVQQGPFRTERELGFMIFDVARLIKTCVDQKAREMGLTRAQWAVLVRLQRMQGPKQTEIAGMLDIQPITLARLIDRLCEQGLVERRPDPVDRRAKRLYLTAKATPTLEKITVIGGKLMAQALDGLSAADREHLGVYLGSIKQSLKTVQQAENQAA